MPRRFLSSAAADMQTACGAARSATPTAACAPSVWLMDPACTQRMLDLLGAPLPDSIITETALRTVATSYLALQEACASLATKVTPPARCRPRPHACACTLLGPTCMPAAPAPTGVDA